jgi:hypothetical protein
MGNRPNFAGLQPSDCHLANPPVHLMKTIETILGNLGFVLTLLFLLFLTVWLIDNL